MTLLWFLKTTLRTFCFLHKSVLTKSLLTKSETLCFYISIIHVGIKDGRSPRISDFFCLLTLTKAFFVTVFSMYSHGRSSYTASVLHLPYAVLISYCFIQVKEFSHVNWSSLIPKDTEEQCSKKWLQRTGEGRNGGKAKNSGNARALFEMTANTTQTEWCSTSQCRHLRSP